MDQWLDSLSEDWVSQPRSQHSSSLLRAPPEIESIGLQSRIPRPKSRTVSSHFITNRGNLESQSLGISVGSRKDILKARTQSELNVPRSSTPDGYAKRGSPRLSTKQTQSGTKSPLSRPSSVLGTIHHKASPNKHQSTNMTPEWKKRLVKGQAGDGEQTDLFSPKAKPLSSVFNPPRASTRSPKNDGGKRWMMRNENVPSSSSKPLTPSNAQRNGYVKKPTPTRNSLGGPMVTGPDQDLSDGFSSIRISKEKTTNGQINYAAIDSSLQRLQSSMNQFHDKQETKYSPGNRVPTANHSKKSSLDTAMQNEKHDITAQSLPDDLSVGTDMFAANGGFVSFKRGGYSDDGSFGRRTLSASSSSRNLDGPSLQAKNLRKDNAMMTEPQRPTLEPRLPSPNTPKRQQQAQSSPERPQSSGSPLKLFDKYDTFTNDRLMRRMSKFEEAFQEASPKKDELEDYQHTFISSPNTEPSQRRVVSGNDESRAFSKASSFGEGELDQYVFPDPIEQKATLPQLPCLAPEEVNKKVPMRRQSAKRKPFRLRMPRDRTSGEASSLRRNTLELELERNHTAQDQSHSEVHHTVHRKRLPYSPAKDPAPKRRRTINSPEERLRTRSAVSVDVLENETHDTPSRPLVGRKRKDALYEKEQQAADPRVLAMRQIRRPRNPTPNQTSSAARQPTEGDLRSQYPTDPVTPSGEADIKVDPPTQIVAGALATIALNAAHDVAQGSRKPSVTTADFFNEAQQIMRLIRAEKRPQSSHTTTEASQIESQIIDEESDLAESTKDDFSRPPSRENGNLLMPKEPARLDSRVVSHLRKYEDKDDLGLALSSSLKSLKMKCSRTSSDISVVHRIDLQERVSNESDPPNVRIIERPIRTESENISTLSYDETANEKQRINSQDSDRSTKGSLPTGSSGSSSRKFVITPETVAHLLSDQMAGMIFDHERQMWIKRKGSINTEVVDASETRSESSEENLFGDIPDLTVNEMEELQMVKDAVYAVDSIPSMVNKINHEQHMSPNLPALTHKETHTGEESRPVTAGSKSIAPVEDSSAPSKYSHFASSGPAPSTRATSWGDDFWPQKLQSMQIPTLDAVNEHVSPNSAEEVEHEISILAGRIAEAPNREGDKHRKTRVVTVAFSSPLVEQLQSSNLPGDLEHASHIQATETPSRRISQRKMSTGRNIPTSNMKRSNQSSLKVSKEDLSYLKRPMSRLDEHEELSIVPYSVNGNRTLQLAVSTPLPLSKSLMLPSSAGQRSSIGFRLSPLADFTVHQVDSPVDAITSKRSSGMSVVEANNRLSFTAQNLVKHLTDLEPYEPYWEYLRTINLRDRGLTSLHMLDEFCEHAEELDVSNNRIGELNGVPSSVRLLNISGNVLSDLSAWHHLQHLQYLNVSSNGLTSLKGLHMLIHLRALKADNNAIDSLEGIEDLDGLLDLRIQRNQLRSVDFESFDLYDVFENLMYIANDHQETVDRSRPWGQQHL